MPDSYDVAIAGGGIGALTAAVHSARMGRSTLVVGGRAPGGLLLSIERIDGVPGFPEGVAGYELCPMLQEQAADDGAEIRMADLEGLEPAGEAWRVQTSDGEVQARTVILATGARLRSLGVEGEERLQGRGVSHCASCDAPLMRDRTVGVVGGGDSALQEALTLADAVGEVIVLHRGDALTAQAAYREPALAHPKISVRYGTLVEEILGEDAIGGVRTARHRVGRDRGPRPRRPVHLRRARAQQRLRRDPIELDDDGRIPTDAAMQTELPGVFAAGIVRRGSLGQAAISAGEGAAAAKAAHRHLDGGHERVDGAPGERPERGQRNRHRRPRPAGPTEAHMAEKLTVHDPRGYPPQVTGKPLAPRLQSLEGQTLYLVDCLFDNSEAFVDQLHAWFSEHMPGVDIKRIAPRESWVDDPEMCAAIQADGDAAVLAVGL